MDVEIALAEERLLPVFGNRTLYYQRKFTSIAEKANILKRDIELHWPIINETAQRRFSWNWAGFVFGPLWGLYRRLPAAGIFAAIALLVQIAEEVLGSSYRSVDRALVITGILYFGGYGNVQVLHRYLKLQREQADPDVIAFQMKVRWAAPLALLAVSGAIAVAPLLVPALNSVSKSTSTTIATVDASDRSSVTRQPQSSPSDTDQSALDRAGEILDHEVSESKSVRAALSSADASYFQFRRSTEPAQVGDGGCSLNQSAFPCDVERNGNQYKIEIASAVDQEIATLNFTGEHGLPVGEPIFQNGYQAGRVIQLTSEAGDGELMVATVRLNSGVKVVFARDGTID